MIQKTLLSGLGLMMLGVSLSAEAAVGSKMIQEAVEYTSKKFGKEVAEEGVERLANKVTQLAAKHGDEVVAAAFKRIGPRAGQIASEAGEHGGLALRLLAKHGDDALPLVARQTALDAVARYGDDAATAILRHGSVGERLVGEFAEQGAEALAKVTPQSGRRLAMVAAEGQLKPELMAVVTKYGDTACDFIWKNKGALAVGTSLAAFVAAPEEFFDGTQKLTSVVADAAIRPLAELPKAVAVEAARNTNWTLLGLVGAAVVGLVAFRWNDVVRNLLQLVAWWRGRA